MPTFRGEKISDSNLKEICETLSDRYADLDKQKWFMVKVAMKKGWVDVRLWGDRAIDKENVIEHLASEFAEGKLDNLFEVAIQDVSLAEVKQLAES